MTKYFTKDEIREISQFFAKKINWTKLYHGEKISKITGNNVFFKLENLQQTGSFKIRGALNKINHLSDEQRQKGLIAASAGNHAQGVALAASYFGIKPLIVMPVLTPLAKVKATKEYGGDVLLHGNFFDDALRKAHEIAQEKNLTFVHPFDDMDVIKGQATIGYEIAQDLEHIDYCFIPIGGGGIISGISHYLKQVNPNIKIVGVQTKNVDSYRQALKHNRPIMIKPKHSIADGIAVKKISDLTFDIMRENVDHVITVSEDEIAKTMLFLLEKCKFVTEGAGAAATAAILFDKLKLKNQNLNIVGIVSGGNVDITTLGNIINNALIKNHRRILLSINSPIGNNAIIDISEIVKKNGAVIHKIRTTLDQENLDINNVNIKLVIDVSNSKQKQKIIKAIKMRGYKVLSAK